LLKEFGAIDYIDFSPLEPNYFAVTCSVRVQVYSALTKLPVKNLNKFKETAYGGSFRSDGLLLCAGGQESVVRLFDVESRSLLRVFHGHTSSVRRSFFTSDKTHIASYSDDKSVILWDIPSEKKLITFTGHNDYIRAGAVSKVSPSTLLSGCYDHKVRMFDSRTSMDPVFTVDHGAPVESVLFLPSGGVFVSAGGTEVRVWDALAGGRLLAKLCQHHKAVTCLHLASDGRRLLSGSLDRHVKVYDVSTYRTVHTIDYTSPILSLAVSQRDSTVVVGTVDGLVSVRRREEDANPLPTRQKRVTYRNVGDFVRSPGLAHDTILAAGNQVVVPNPGKVKELKHDAHLRKFEYSKALDSVMLPYIVNKTPHVTVSLLQELSRRKGLETALAGRDGKSLHAILRFLTRYIGDYRFTRVLILVSNTLLDIYGDNLVETGAEACQLLMRLGKKLREEESLTLSLVSLQGACQMLLGSSGAGEAGPAPADTDPLKPSSTAMQNLVISVS